MSIKIYHNPQCSTSRRALEILQEKNLDFETIAYLENTPSKEELKELINILGIKAEDLVRKKEPIFKEKFEGKKMTNATWISAMIKYPKLIERPIVIHGNKAAIGRPVEKILTIF